MLIAGNLSEASICNNPIKISGLGNHVPTFQILKKMKAGSNQIIWLCNQIIRKSGQGKGQTEK